MVMRRRDYVETTVPYNHPSRERARRAAATRVRREALYGSLRRKALALDLPPDDMAILVVLATEGGTTDAGNLFAELLGTRFLPSINEDPDYGVGFSEIVKARTNIKEARRLRDL